MTQDLFETYYQQRTDAITSQDPENTFITRDGIEVRTFVDDAMDTVGDVIEGAAEAGSAVLHGLAKGSENINKAADSILPGSPMQGIANLAGQAADALGVDTFIPEPTDLGDSLLSGVSQMAPGMLPAIRVLKGLGAAPGMLTEALGGFIGDMLTTGDDDAEGMIKMIDAIPGETADSVVSILTEFINDPQGNPQQLESRLIASAPGLVLGPAFEKTMRGIASLASAAKNSGVGQDLIQAITERGAASDQRLQSMAEGTTLSANPVNAVGDLIMSATGRAASRLSNDPADEMAERGFTTDEMLEAAWMDETSGNVGVRGSTNVLDDTPLTFNQKPIQMWSPKDFEAVGNDLGIKRLGPASTPSPMTLMDGREVNIPGGLEGKFTYYDMLQIKAQGIDASQIPESVHAQLQKKMSRSLQIDKLSDNQVWAGLAFGMTSPNNPLFPNQLAMSRLRGDEAVNTLADSINWNFGDEVDPAVRKETNDAIAAQFGLNAGKAGGLGARGTQDYTRVAEMAKLFKENPTFFRRQKGEDWPEFSERVFSQVAGLRAKTGSFSVVFQDPLEAGVSAIDRHMARMFTDQILDTPKKRLAWQKRTLDLYNKNNKLRGDKKITSMSDVPDGFIGQMILSEVGKTSSPKFRTADGNINPNVPQRLRDTDFIVEPKNVELMGEQYKAALQANQEEALKHGLGIFSSQWMLWDRMRRRLEPHENMFPGLERVPRPSIEQARQTDIAHKESGHKDYTKEIVDEESGEFRLRPTKSTQNPAKLAYFSIPLAMMMMQDANTAGSNASGTNGQEAIVQSASPAAP